MKFLVFCILFLSIKSWAFTLACPSNATECEGWNVETLSVELNASNCPSTITAEVEEAFELWNKVSTSSLKLEVGAANNDTPATIVARVQTTPEAHNMVIACDPNFQTTLGLSAAEANAIAGVANNNTVQGNAIDTGYVLLNVQSGASANVSNLSAELRKVIIAHEVGHALGLGHSEENASLMFFSATSKENLNLHQDDIDGLSYLYPRSEPSDGVLGCGLIKGAGGPPPPSTYWILALLFVPLMVWGRLRAQLSSQTS